MMSDTNVFFISWKRTCLNSNVIIAGVTPLVDRTDDSDWDEEDLLPLMPHGKTFKEYVMYDDNLATENPWMTIGKMNWC